jgi:hypothetical protein
MSVTLQVVARENWVLCSPAQLGNLRTSSARLLHRVDLSQGSPSDGADSVCLSVRLSVCLSVCPSYESVCLSVCPSVVCLTICLSVCPSVCPSVHLSVRPSVRPSFPRSEPPPPPPQVSCSPPSPPSLSPSLCPRAGALPQRPSPTCRYPILAAGMPSPGWNRNRTLSARWVVRFRRSRPGRSRPIQAYPGRAGRVGTGPSRPRPAWARGCSFQPGRAIPSLSGPARADAIGAVPQPCTISAGHFVGRAGWAGPFASGPIRVMVGRAGWAGTGGLGRVGLAVTVPYRPGLGLRCRAGRSFPSLNCKRPPSATGTPLTGLVYRPLR